MYVYIYIYTIHNMYIPDARAAESASPAQDLGAVLGILRLYMYIYTCICMYICMYMYLDKPLN